MRVINYDVDCKWADVSKLFDGDNDSVEAEMWYGLVDGIEMAGGEVKMVAQISNLIAHRGEVSNDLEDVVQLPDGRIVLVDTGEGNNEITVGPVTNVDAFLDKLEKAMSA